MLQFSPTDELAQTEQQCSDPTPCQDALSAGGG
jgi:hypothetical protein